MQNSISLDDVIASEKKFKCVLTYNAKKARDLKTLNPKSKYDTTYIPLLFKHINGKEMPVKIGSVSNLSDHLQRRLRVLMRRVPPSISIFHL